jgi:DNA-directed RNA polymerase subunit RPC12/RpoP
MEVREPRSQDWWPAVVWMAVLLGLAVLAVFLVVRFGVGPWALLLIIPGVWLLMRWMSRAWAYRCPQCGEVFQLTTLGQLKAINMGDERNVRCPKCGQRSWVRTLRKVT